nr:MAG TPA: hypothetical protein [Caudoviricetes sp.]
MPDSLPVRFLFLRNPQRNGEFDVFSHQMMIFCTIVDN